MKYFLILISLLYTHNLFAQKYDQADLYNTWYLDKYSDEEAYFQPPKKELGDYITFNEDMTFEAKSEGEINTGTWMFNTNGNYLELKSKNSKPEKLYIYFLSKKSLVVIYDVDEYRVWEVHYVSCK